MGARTALPVAIVLWLALLAGAGVGSALVLPLALTSLGFAWLARRAPPRTGLVALLVAVALAGVARGAGHARRLEAERAALGDGERVVRYVARVTEPPAREADAPSAVVRIDAAGDALPAGARVRLRLPPQCEAEWGDRIAGVMRVESPPSRRNPGGWDARAAADGAAVAASGRALTARVEAARGAHAVPRATVMRLRRALEGAYARRLEPRARELVTPLVTGDRGAVPIETGADLRAAGIIHLLALSGLHVAWMASLAAGACASLGAGVRGRAIAAAACALLYGALAGPLASMARAVATELAMAGARLAGRALDPVQALALGAVLLLAVAPGWAADLGFQLSCAATLGLVTLGATWSARAGRWRPALATAIATTAAQAAAMPLLLLRFHALSWPGAIANLAAVPVSGLLLVAAWLAGLVELAAPGAARTLFAACDALALALRAIAARAASLPQAMVSCGEQPVAALMMALGAAATMVAASSPRTLAARASGDSPARRLAWVMGGALVAIGLLLAATARPLAPPAGRWWWIVLDVGQGDAMLIAEGRSWWAIDAGPRQPRWDAGERVVLPALRWAGVRRLERLVLTHDDGDHTGGATALRRGLPVGRVIVPAGQESLRVRFAAFAADRGDTLAGAWSARVRWPPDAGDGGAAMPRAPVGTPDNVAGLVIEIGRGAGRVLMPADVDSTVEAVLDVAPGPALLKLSHHGSASSSGAGFLARLAPAGAVVSAGRGNRYGHPHPAVLARAAAIGARVHRTDRDGALWFELSEDDARLVEWRRGAQRRATHGGIVAAARAPARR